MPTDYEKVYQQQRHALGKPTQVFVDFFDVYDKAKADVLDIGCGQGRDALFIARLGHHVTGVDLSKTGITQLLEDAKSEGLSIDGIVADLRAYVPQHLYDVVVIDRTLHMLDADNRLQVLERVSGVVRDDGFMLIADEKSNMAAIKKFFNDDHARWKLIQDKNSFVSFQHIPSSDSQES